MNTNISEEQSKVIKYIEENLEIEFEGKTKQEARLFISVHIEDSQKAHKKKKEEAIHFLFELIAPSYKSNRAVSNKIDKYKKLF